MIALGIISFFSGPLSRFHIRFSLCTICKCIFISFWRVIEKGKRLQIMRIRPLDANIGQIRGPLTNLWIILWPSWTALLRSREKQGKLYLCIWRRTYYVCVCTDTAQVAEKIQAILFQITPLAIKLLIKQKGTKIKFRIPVMYAH